jgi:hypothetical protein
MPSVMIEVLPEDVKEHEARNVLDHNRLSTAHHEKLCKLA